MPDLSILIFQDAEKSSQYLNDYMGALHHWNEEGLAKSQIILITQKQTTDEAQQICKRNCIEATIMKSDNFYVGAHPIWDVMADLRKAWPKISGDYVTVNHSEFIWCQSRLAKTIVWLKANKPYLSLGNLRRPAKDRVPRPRWRPGNCDRRISEPLALSLKRGDWQRASRIAEILPTLIWPLWKANIYKFGECHWSEDVFFADRRWMEAWKATEHGGELPFQDIWDLMGAAIKRMAAQQLEPTIIRMTESVNRIIHMWHPKNYKSWTPEIRDWFLGDPKRWQGTQFIRPQLWQRLLQLRDEKNTNDQYAKYDLRRGPGGTLTRYEEAVRQYLLNCGGFGLVKFYEKYGRPIRQHEYA